MTNRKLSLQFTEWDSLQFAERLKVLVDSYKNNSSLAREVGVVEGTIRKWANGFSRPKVDEAVKLAHTLGVHLLWLATGEGPKYLTNPPEKLEPPKLILDPSMPSGFNRSLVFIRKATTAVELMGKDAPTERKVEAVEKVYKRLSETDGAADMIEIMQLIQATLEGDVKP